ncbi:MAG TPA: glycosyltransferase family 4 protein [Solirubrobacteraceae bacterium]|nr:glycosyltransferase family 4 protein [Solirubrobacteraceae bacterium]
MARVLAVGTMYPPQHLGGYELLWRDTTLALRAAGHEVRVLAVDLRLGAAAELDGDVHRELCWYWSDHTFPRRARLQRIALERHNTRVLAGHLDALRPDAVMWWALGGLSLSLVEHVRRRGVPALGVVGDEWMAYGPRVDQWLSAWEARPRLAGWAAAVTRTPTRFAPGRAARWLFISDFLREEAQRVTDGALADTGVVHPGIDAGRFPPAAPRPWEGRLLYCGRIDERKGIADAVAALAHLPEATLRVDGAGDAAHLGSLREQAAELGVAGRVTFARSPRDELAGAYAAADAVLFPVRWPEPWGLVPLEAMSVGRPVVATGTGGSAEYLSDGDNALVVPPGDPPALGAAVRRLAQDPALRERLVAGGRRTAGSLTQAAFETAVERELRAVARRS